MNKLILRKVSFVLYFNKDHAVTMKLKNSYFSKFRILKQVVSREGEISSAKCYCLDLLHHAAIPQYPLMLHIYLSHEYFMMKMMID